ncbi:Outer membrane porin F [Sulfitobacter indolifex]|uniref:OmpA family domain protein n=1 Tax=Sulfitobacter indolifex HEL-45 TaxID=391624 RepID=A0ABM9XAT5_9RHOB|nr:OmpA family protein [Sulfitobacter indolifex]EDQ06615.1 OmpA family domain protein [Sulfitobacter indolifex HEL-45]UOA17605.1 Outer membrane porin F [Sulfitobacter indolifex]
MSRAGVAAALIGLLLAAPATALELALPSTARMTAERNTAPDRYAAPVGVYADGQVARVNVDGSVRRAAWRMDTPGLTALQVMRPLRQQLSEAGYDIVLDCAARECGGFDFRFAIEVLPGPNMYVNLRAFHFITALRRADDGTPTEAISILASTAATSAYVQIVQARSGDAPEGESTPITPEATAEVPLATATGDLAATLKAEGHVVLNRLEFETGTSALGAGPFATLERLAELLKADPGLRVALVGHTDAVGSLEANTVLSRKRAEAVRERLVQSYDVDPDRLEARGAGYLAPRGSNLTEAGREENRRVEVVVLSAE